MTRHFARNTLLRTILDVADSFGASRKQVLSAIGLAPFLADQSGGFVPSEAIIDAMEYAASATGRTDFGLLIADRLDHRTLGPLGLLIEQADSITEIQTFSSRFLRLHNSALKYSIERGKTRATMLLQILAKSAYEPRHYVEALFSICVRMGGFHLGTDWRPLTVNFMHSKLGPDAAYERHFGKHVRFNQDKNTITLRAGDLDRSIATREPELKRMLDNVMRQLELQHTEDFGAKVSQLARILLPSNEATVQDVAQLLGIKPRVLQRRLQAHGTNFARVRAQVRLDMIKDYVRQDGFTLTEMAPLLGFSEVSALSRFVRAHAAIGNAEPDDAKPIIDVTVSTRA